MIPFETGFAALCVYNGVSGILSYGAVPKIFEQMLGYKFSLVFNIAYVISGLLMYLGIGLNRRNVEAFGVIIIMMSLSIRSLVVFFDVGFYELVVNSYVFATTFLISAAVRVYSLFAGITIIESQSKVGKT